MAVSSAALKEFVRKVYRQAQVNVVTRDVYLDGLADVVLVALSTGRSISSSSGNGTSVSYELFAGWQPDHLLEVIAEARDHISLATAVLAIAEIKTVRAVSGNYEKLYK